jgi:CDP-diacylglycerol pyrophosphatase
MPRIRHVGLRRCRFRQSYWRGGPLTLTFVPAAVAALLLLYRPAQAQVTQCQLDANNTLLSLANCCATDVKSNPSCMYYSAAHKFVIIKDNDPQKPDAYLIVPTDPVKGIEDPQIFLAPVVDFWDYGWNEAERYIKQSPDNTGLAINSAHGRTQNQLHIHISCVIPSVAAILASNDANIGSDPTHPWPQSLGPHGNPYEVMRVKSLATNGGPFTLVKMFPQAEGHMGDQSIAVIGSKTAGVYYVLDTYFHGPNLGAAEELLNQTCK